MLNSVKCPKTDSISPLDRSLHSNITNEFLFLNLIDFLEIWSLKLKATLLRTPQKNITEKIRIYVSKLTKFYYTKVVKLYIGPKKSILNVNRFQNFILLGHFSYLWWVIQFSWISSNDLWSVYCSSCSISREQHFTEWINKICYSVDEMFPLNFLFIKSHFYSNGIQ